MTSAQSENQKEPKGLFEVGSKTIFIHDATSGFDPVGGVADGIRTLITEIWYPVSPLDIPQKALQPVYGDYVFKNRAVHDMMMYDTTFFHARRIDPVSHTLTVRPGVSQDHLDRAVEALFSRKRDSYLDLLPADTPTGFPVVIFSHGDAGSRYNLETVCGYLASHGYIVAAPDHTGNSPFSMVGMDPGLDQGSAVITPHGVYGGTDPAAPFYGQTYQAFQSIPGTTVPDILKADLAVMQRVNDVRAVIAKLEQMNESGPFSRRMDLNRIGIMGRSFGGTTSLAGLELVKRFKAGMAVVPASIPDLRRFYVDRLGGTLPQNRETALLEPDMKKIPAFAAMNKPCLIVNCKEDGIIIKYNEIFNQTPSDRPTPDNTHPALYKVFRSAKGPVVWAMLENADHGSCGVAGHYWWPEIKRNRYPRYFNSNASFTLIHPRKAHAILKALAKNFFDFHLKNDRTVLDALLISSHNALAIDHKNYL